MAKEFKVYKATFHCSFWDEIPCGNGDWEYSCLYRWEKYMIIRATSPNKAIKTARNLRWQSFDSTNRSRKAPKYGGRQDILKFNKGIIDTNINDIHMDLIHSGDPTVEEWEA